MSDDNLRFISKIHRSQCDERRKYEWKIVLTLLTFYVVSLATKYGGKANLPSDCVFKSIVYISYFFMAIITSIFLGYIHMANNKNKAIAENAEDALFAESADTKIIKIIRSDIFSYNTRNYWTSWNNFSEKESGRWSWLWQTITLIAFSIISAYLFTSA